MSWNRSTTVLDRVFACLPYIIPLISVLGFGIFLFKQLPILQILFLPLAPFVLIIGQLNSLLAGFGDLLILLALLLLVVRNPDISRFIRFNTMQAILLDIVVSIAGLIAQYLITPVFGTSGLIMETLSNMVFLGIVAACGYSIFQSALGNYATIPTISDAANTQVP